MTILPILYVLLLQDDKKFSQTSTNLTFHISSVQSVQCIRNLAINCVIKEATKKESYTAIFFAMFHKLTKWDHCIYLSKLLLTPKSHLKLGICTN